VKWEASKHVEALGSTVGFGYMAAPIPFLPPPTECATLFLNVVYVFSSPHLSPGALNPYEMHPPAMLFVITRPANEVAVFV